MNYVIIVAGGKGLRMGADLPKQFLPVGGKPVLMRTIERFHTYDETLEIILVLPHEQQPYWRQLCRDYDFPIRHLVVDGGTSRFHSSWNGLRAIPDDAEGLVGIHDGVRPFPSPDAIRRCYETAAQTGAAIPVVPVVDSLRHVGKDVSLSSTDGCPSSAVPRSDYRIVQTPQVFSIQLAKRAYLEAGASDSSRFTDDASVVEACGHSVTMVDGNRENIKLTTPFDLAVAEALLSATL